MHADIEILVAYLNHGNLNADEIPREHSPTFSILVLKYDSDYFFKGDLQSRICSRIQIQYWLIFQ